MQALDEVISNASDVGRPFWVALSEGRLQLPHCKDCARAFFFPRRICPNCWSSQLDWIPASGRGRVFSLTVVHVPFQGISKDELPIATGLVDLEEGVRLPARFDLAALPKIGDTVRCRFLAGPGQYPVFLPEVNT